MDKQNQSVLGTSILFYLIQYHNYYFKFLLCVVVAVVAVVRILKILNVTSFPPKNGT